MRIAGAIDQILEVAVENSREAPATDPLPRCLADVVSRHVPVQTSEGPRQAVLRPTFHHVRIGAGLGRPGRIDRLLLVDADRFGDVIPLRGELVEDRLADPRRPTGC